MKRVKLIAVLAGLAAAFCLYLFLQKAAEPTEIPKSRVVCAAVDIGENIVITMDMLTYTTIPTEAVLNEAVTDMSFVVGKVSNSRVLAGEQILPGRLVELVDDMEVGSLAYTVNQGMRAATISVSATSGLNNMLLPGNRVDVVLIYEVTEEEGSLDAAGNLVMEETSVLTSRLLFQNVIILAVDKRMDKTPNPEVTYATVTLELSCEDALTLALAENLGTFKLLLRSPIDGDEQKLDAVTAELLD